MSSSYESDKLLSEYLLFHFGAADEILPLNRVWPTGMREALDFPVRTVAHFTPGPVATGLDLGCAVGRSTFEMARTCDHVTGIDFSHSFIRAAEVLRRGEVLAYERLEEAAMRTALVARVPGGVDGTKIDFMRGDAMDLPDALGAFDRVHAANLLCRLPRPKELLERLPAMVKSGGELVLATPCTWLEEFTLPEHWPKAGTFEWLQEVLAPHFALTCKAEEPFLIRETARKFQWTTSLVTVWKRS